MSKKNLEILTIEKLLTKDTQNNYKEIEHNEENNFKIFSLEEITNIFGVKLNKD